MTETGERTSGQAGLGWPGAMAAMRPGARPGAGAQDRAGLPHEDQGPALEANLGFRLGRAHRAVRAAWQEKIADLGLSPPQAALLRAAAQRPGCGLRELARLMNTDAMNAKRLADHLEYAGLLTSASDPGHRQRRALRLTEAGVTLARELARRAAEHQQALTRLIGPGDVIQLLGLLDRLETAVASGPPPGPAATRADGRPVAEGGHQ